MSIVLQSKNPILLEGLWGLGKTQLAEKFCEKYGYRHAYEPFHTYTTNLDEIKDLDRWYLEKHFSRISLFESESPVLVERSLLSTFAFLYALNKELPDEKYVRFLKDEMSKRKVLLVYLFSDQHIDIDVDNSKNYSHLIQAIIQDNEIRRRYDEWFTAILPNKYGIVPLVLPITEKGVRKSADTLATQVALSLQHKRVAQVNVVCFSRQSIAGQTGPAVLVLKRNAEKGGFWQTVTGGIKPGEDLIDAAKREVEEETSFVVPQIWPTGFSYSFMGNDEYELREYVLGAEIGDPTGLILSMEHSAYEWLAPETAVARIKYEGNKDAIWKVCTEMERSRGPLH